MQNRVKTDVAQFDRLESICLTKLLLNNVILYLIALSVRLGFMNETNLIIEGLQLMLVGMGMVFVFLTVLVVCTSMMEKIFSAPAKESSPETRDSQITAEEVAAISVAIHSYRSKHHK